MTHARAAAAFLADRERVTWHDTAVWAVRLKRDAQAHAVPEWEALREAAAGIKAHTMGRLAEYLEEFERNATRNGAVVHWARDAAEHNRIVLGILRARGATRLVKSKSMLTEECGLNAFLEHHGVTVTDTDLGERIVQLAGIPPSHIVMPAIHLRQDEVGELFHRLLGTPEGLSDPTKLTAAARLHLRERFLACDAALTGVNFGVAETGGIVVVTNEGNADLGITLAPLHIASMGIEKLVPRLEHLGVFLRLLARSATGQPVSAYTTHVHAPRPGAELHIVIVDNGRSAQLARPAFRKSLHCIRCAACLNTCPVFRRSGGYRYGYVLPGPIGQVLAPGVDARAHRDLPFASSLCLSCGDVCPVKVDLPDQLYRWRQRLGEAGLVEWWKKVAMPVMGWVLARPWAYELTAKLARWALRRFPRRLLGALAGPWTADRELPDAPAEAFRDWYRKHRGRGPAL
ncbi:MAG: lactate utilization protein B [Gemmatimonadales bacterium]